jgi:hypothetical protein
LDPLLVPDKFQWRLLEAFFRNLAGDIAAAILHFAKAVLVSTTMICSNSPGHLHSGPCNPRRYFEQWGHLRTFPTLLEAEKSFSSSTCRAREVAATIEATWILDRSTARIPSWVSLLDIFEKALVPHSSTLDGILKADFGFVIEQCPEFRMPERYSWACWIWAILLAYMVSSRSLFATNERPVVEPKTATTCTVGSAHIDTASASRRWLIHHGVSCRFDNKYQTCKTLHSAGTVSTAALPETRDLELSWS